jgi:hypothetical protein
MLCKFERGKQEAAVSVPYGRATDVESAVRGTLTRTALAAAIAGLAMIGATVPANAQDDPACEMLGWRHPLCAAGAFDSPPDDGIPGDNAAIGGIPAPSMVPNIDGTLSLPGTPGAI